MRIGITCYPTYGGSGAVATELGLELARRGHEVHFISYASPFRLRGYAERVTFHEVMQTEYPLFEHSSPYALALAVKQHEVRSEEHTSELQSPCNLVCRLLLEKKNKKENTPDISLYSSA